MSGAAEALQRRVGWDRGFVCAESRRWVREQGDATLQQLWNQCPRGDWMAWLVAYAALLGGRGSAAWWASYRVAVHIALGVTPIIQEMEDRELVHDALTRMWKTLGSGPNDPAVLNGEADLLRSICAASANAKGASHRAMYAAYCVTFAAADVAAEEAIHALDDPETAAQQIADRIRAIHPEVP